MASNSLEMKVDLSDFLTARGTLEAKENDLMTILERYGNIRKRASEFIEDDDSRFAKMQEAVEVEISKVKAQLKLVQKIQNQINKIVDAMDSMEESSNRIIDQSKETIKEGIESIIDLKSLGL